MGLIKQAELDLKEITTNGSEFGEAVVFTSAVNGQVAEINCLHSDINVVIGFNEAGQPVHSRKVTVVFSESALSDLGYPTRNSSGQIAMNKDKVDIASVNKPVKNYVVKSQLPDSTVGLITLFLEDYDSSN
jgi:hypothetical protein